MTQDAGGRYFDTEDLAQVVIAHVRLLFFSLYALSVYRASGFLVTQSYLQDPRWVVSRLQKNQSVVHKRFGDRRFSIFCSLQSGSLDAEEP